MTRLAALAAVALAIGGCGSSTSTAPSSGDASPAGGGSAPVDAAFADTADQVAATLTGLPTTTGPWSGRIATADAVLPPTNSWLAPAVFAPDGRPVFTGVLSFRPLADGFDLGLAEVTVQESIVMGAHPQHVPIGLPSDEYVLETWDDLSGTFLFTADGQEVGRLQAAQGWPYLAWTAAADQELTLPASSQPTDDGATFEVGDTAYHVTTEGTVSGTSLELADGEHAVFWAEPDGATPADLDLLVSGAQPLDGTATTYEVGEAGATTTLEYRAAGPTVMAALPHQQEELTADGEPLSGTYATVLGDLALVAGTAVSSTIPLRDVVPALDVSRLGEEERTEVEDLVRADVGGLALDAVDSYFGGKQLQRATQLYVLARDLGLEAERDAARTAITEVLDEWMDPAGCEDRGTRCFALDETLGGVVGQEPSYGSDEFNDHHFHYGHFLYAVGTLAQDDPELVERYREVADLLAWDFAAPVSAAGLPERRAFDDWAGHSWASGTAPFGDGNNQESSSEAVNAWAGLLLWARASEQDAMAEQAQWMLSTEIATALAYWMDPDLPPEFGHPSVGIVWQGKRDFATFFNADPSAVIGIQLIPMTPTHADYLSEAPVQALVDHAIPDGAADHALADYVVMAQALVDPAAAEEMYRSLPADQIDNGNSAAYMLAFILTAS